MERAILGYLHRNFNFLKHHQNCMRITHGNIAEDIIIRLDYFVFIYSYIEII